MPTDTTAATAPGFVHLHVLTAFSALEGAIRTKDLAARAAELGMPAVAITDIDTLSGAPEATKNLSAKGVQPIIGANVGLLPEEVDAQGLSAGDLPRIVLIAKDAVGYANLVQLLSRSNVNSLEPSLPFLTWDDLAELGDGLILLTGGARGPVDRALLAGDAALAHARLSALAHVFGDRLYVEISRQVAPATPGTHREGAPRDGDDEERRDFGSSIETELVALADALEVPLVATNPAYFLDAADHAYHDAFLCIGQGAYVETADRRRVSPDAWLRPPREMIALFSDLPDAVENTLAIARRCAVAFEKRKPMLPAYPDLDGRSEAEELRRQASAGLERRLEKLRISGQAAIPYRERLDYECGVIEKMGFPGYFLIVSDFIKWAKRNGISVGPGRGSGAGSLVAYAMEITDLDPLRFGLLFERFLNPDRVSMPDFDIDFCQERREEVIEYVKRRYAGERVAQIGTIGKLQARAAVRDTGRVLQMPFGLVDRLCKMIPADPGNPIPLGECVRMEPLRSEVLEGEQQVRDLFRIAARLEGLHRNTSTHAAGVVISDRPVSELVPIYKDKDGNFATQYDMKGVEDAGLVKFDFLGLKTLDIIQQALAMVAETGVRVDFDEIDFEDEETYAMLRAGRSYGVFQLESGGMVRAMRQIGPTRIDDLVALVSLYRPGPMENIPVYAQRKAGLAPVELLHPRMGPALEETYGIIVYQEQVMQLARDLAGYSLGQADLLRRAMGKKIKAEMDAQKSVFIDGAVANGIEAATAGEIFALIERFASYGFNKSHAAAYAAIAFYTAYLKRHHPHEFFAASMNLDIASSEKLALSQQVMRAEGLRLLMPDVNRSAALFRVERGEAPGAEEASGAVRWGLAGIRGLGLSSMHELVAERERGGPFEDFFDLVERTHRILDKRSYETLVRSGALDGLPGTRSAKLRVLAGESDEEFQARRGPSDSKAVRDRGILARLADPKRKDVRQVSLFDAGLERPRRQETMPDLPEAPREVRLKDEHDLLGFWRSGHPLAELDLPKGITPLAEAIRATRAGRAGTYDVLVFVTDAMRRTTRAGDPMAIVRMSDASASAEAVLFGDTCEAHWREIRSYAPLYLRVDARMRDDQPSFMASRAEPVEDPAAFLEQWTAVRAAGRRQEAVLGGEIDRALEQGRTEAGGQGRQQGRHPQDRQQETAGGQKKQGAGGVGFAALGRRRSDTERPAPRP